MSYVPALLYGVVPNSAAIGLLALLAVAGITLLILHNWSAAFIPYWAALVVSQNAALGLSLSTHGSGTDFYLFTELKTCSLFTGLAWVLIKRLRAHDLTAHPLNSWYLALVGWVLIRAIAQNLTPASLAYIRNFLAFGAALLVGSYIQSRSPTETGSILRATAIVVTGVLLVGQMVEASLGTTAWRSALHTDRLGAVLDTASTSTWFFGVYLTRLGGWVVEPVNSGYLFATCLLGFLMTRSGMRANTIPAICAFIGLAASGGRGALLVVVAAVLFGRFNAVRQIVARHPLATVVCGVPSLVIALLAYIALVDGSGVAMRIMQNPLVVPGRGDSAQFHVAGLLGGIHQALARPLGAGLGAGGNFGAIFDVVSGRDIRATGGESALAGLIFQLGLPGLVSWVAMCSHLIRAAALSLHRLPLGLVMGWGTAWVIQENIGGPQAGGLLTLLLGMALADQLKSRRRRSELTVEVV